MFVLSIHRDEKCHQINSSSGKENKNQSQGRCWRKRHSQYYYLVEVNVFGLEIQSNSAKHMQYFLSYVGQIITV